MGCSRMSLPAAIPRVLRVTDETRGQAIRSRRTRLGKSVRFLANEANVDRGAATRAENDEPGVSDLTYQRLEGALDRLEHQRGIDDPERTLFILELPDGTKVRMPRTGGTPEEIARAAAEFLRSRES